MNPGTRMGDGMARRGLLRPLQNQCEFDIFCIPCLSLICICYWFYKGLRRNRCAIPSHIRAQGRAQGLLKPIQNRSFCQAGKSPPRRKIYSVLVFASPEHTPARGGEAEWRTDFSSGLYKTNRKCKSVKCTECTKCQMYLCFVMV